MYDDKIIDIITEILNIGMGEAANSLSKLVNTHILIKVPDVRVMQLADIHKYISDELDASGVYMSQIFTGYAKGKAILFYPKDCSVSLLNSLCGQTDKISDLTEVEIATLNEIGNMVIGSCMAEIANVLKSKISFEFPEVTVETSGKYFQNMLKDLGKSDMVIIVKNVMCIKETDIQGYFFVMLSFEDVNHILDDLRKKMN
ncbi:chemotaxis protein CheC [Desulfonema magnum]|uniref:Chemotaxis protein CheC domain-containing protein n=1 Tax=Desulfonema magnum TaxID=45655 RepID=A0A975BM82_9BACT|nr:chemotaxis protein CheC [Desulfonema magnum]QTA88041.1 Chemotaxis protein CheC domain-containing protein [Desulfonema magnum]